MNESARAGSNANPATAEVLGGRKWISNRLLEASLFPYMAP